MQNPKKDSQAATRPSSTLSSSAARSKSQRQVSFAISETLACHLERLIAQAADKDPAAPKTIADLARDCLIVCSAGSFFATDLLEKVGLRPES